MLAYLNGNYLPLDEARISPMDRGFLFGDGAYEVIPVYSRRPFRLQQHLERLERTLAALQLANPLSKEQWAEVVQRLVDDHGSEDLGVYLQVTRGAAPVRDQAFPRPAVAPTVFAYADRLPTPSAELLATGGTALTAEDFRWLRCDLKTVSLVANVLLRQLSAAAGCTETILLRDGLVMEGSASNVLVVQDGVILAPPKSNLILPGVTYDVVLELAAANGIPTQVRPVAEAELRSADEVWVTSSTKEVLPITRIDDAPVADGRPGPLAARMNALYQDFKNQVMRRADA
ncbi:branched-chain amino acid aminotransferase/4-amino-4-deoxychorismate lyase [Azospira oryzae PS]|uniref:Branched-chain amino acid aminotransferase/4-amino-4-deoxychorismate lyase n=1 Tax=Azospira oryzae (strain ATCC BAA-33 / DSM 13638 / PS) TaxID=640081 RepID=G8QIE6_AZOOP|nr:D-amino acid aminotransferase [Azospira oryzae]AEV25306.1 branched-chain amino acid aminotransferase/4-amino-4-deoxychorismate lyase [Azospira oryzae PS]